MLTPHLPELLFTHPLRYTLSKKRGKKGSNRAENSFHPGKRKVEKIYSIQFPLPLVSCPFTPIAKKKRRKKPNPYSIVQSILPTISTNTFIQPREPWLIHIRKHGFSRLNLGIQWKTRAFDTRHHFNVDYTKIVRFNCISSNVDELTTISHTGAPTEFTSTRCSFIDVHWNLRQAIEK